MAEGAEMITVDMPAEKSPATVTFTVQAGGRVWFDQDKDGNKYYSTVGPKGPWIPLPANPQRKKK